MPVNKKLIHQLPINKILGWMILIVSFVGGWIIMDIQATMRAPLVKSNQAAVMYTLQAGTTLTGLAHDLHQRQLLAHPRYFIWAARWRGKANQIQAGEYQFEPGTSVEQMLEMMVSGKVAQFPMTIIEGWTFQQLLAALAQQTRLQQTLNGLDDTQIMARLGYPEQHPEGRFFPDTYYYTSKMSDVQILQRAYEAMQQFLATAWPQRDLGLPYDTPYEALIMASIIEKETGVADERQQIAGVFVRRLQKRMRLQTDPTVIYGLGERFDGNLRRRDLVYATPYNTYVIRGLPPSPIALPGADSILAALHPAPGDSLYFVARGDGTHYFSATHDEHNQAVRKFQLNRNTHDN